MIELEPSKQAGTTSRQLRLLQSCDAKKTVTRLDQLNGACRAYPHTLDTKLLAKLS